MTHSGTRSDAPGSDGITVHWRETGEALDSTTVAELAQLLAGLVEGGAALGWVEPPTLPEVRRLLDDVGTAEDAGDAALAWAADTDGRIAGMGYWRRYQRPTHRPHADIERVAVAPGNQGQGVGRAIVARLIEAAREAGVEQLTLDARGDNQPAFKLYTSLGFVEYGRLADFVAFDERRYDKVFMVLDLRPPV